MYCYIVEWTSMVTILKNKLFSVETTADIMKYSITAAQEKHEF